MQFAIHNHFAFCPLHFAFSLRGAVRDDPSTALHKFRLPNVLRRGLHIWAVTYGLEAGPPVELLPVASNELPHWR